MLPLSGLEGWDSHPSLPTARLPAHTDTPRAAGIAPWLPRGEFDGWGCSSAPSFPKHGFVPVPEAEFNLGEGDGQAGSDSRQVMREASGAVDVSQTTYTGLFVFQE